MLMIWILSGFILFPSEPDKPVMQIVAAYYSENDCRAAKTWTENLPEVKKENGDTILSCDRVPLQSKFEPELKDKEKNG